MQKKKMATLGVSFLNIGIYVSLKNKPKPWSGGFGAEDDEEGQACCSLVKYLTKTPFVKQM